MHAGYLHPLVALLVPVYISGLDCVLKTLHTKTQRIQVLSKTQTSCWKYADTQTLKLQCKYNLGIEKTNEPNHII